jgi:3-methyladenine DNA glycosylase AlkD
MAGMKTAPPVQSVQSILAELKSKGNEKTRQIYARHGLAPERTFGVSIADLKIIAKTIKGQQLLACQLYETGKMEAMYLAGLVADGSQLTKTQLQTWAASASDLRMISEYTVPWLAVENPHARELAFTWIKSPEEHLASCGWCTYSGLLATRADETLDMAEIQLLLDTIVKEIAQAQNRVRYTMNNFVIATGTYVTPLLQQAKSAARKLGAVTVNMGDTACKVPLATVTIEKNEAAVKTGGKRKTIRC